MNKDHLTRLIMDHNPHLRGQKIDVPGTRRDLYSEIERWLKKRPIIGITGLRRTGKTTLMLQIMKGLGKEASYFSFDEEEAQTKQVLTFIIDFLIKNFGSKYIFLDEIHYVDDWEGVLKRYYDQKKVKFVISGSESLEVGKSTSALTGRVVVFKLPPLHFSEYLDMRGHRLTTKVPDIDDEEGIKKFQLHHLTESSLFERELLEYAFKGAFPELVEEDDDGIIRKYIKDMVVKKIVHHDIPSIFTIKRKDLLFDLFRYVCENSANLFDFQKLSSIFQANYETVRSYMFYLENSYLIRIAETYTGSVAKRMRRLKKIYVVHPSLAMASLHYHRDMLIDRILGQYVETLFAGERFWRDKSKNEVDRIMIKGKRIIPLEVKYQSKVTNRDIKGLLRFMDEYRLDLGLVATKDKFKAVDIDGKRIIFAPAWLLLLVVQKEDITR